MRKYVCMAAIVLTAAGSAIAAPITPSFDDFGELAPATFGGDGIPNDPVAITTIIDGGNTITLGLASHGRFANPDQGNDGAGTYFARTGSNFGDPTFVTMPSSSLGATWNVNFYIDIAGGGSFDDYIIELVYDFDPAAGTDETDHGVLDFNGAITALGGDPALVSFTEGSENLLFSFFADGGLPFITVPTPGSFDPSAIGEYSLALIVRDTGGSELGRSAIHVLTTPEPSTMALLGMGGIGLALGGYRRRRNRNRTAA